MVGLRIYDDEYSRLVLVSPTGKKTRVINVVPDQIVPGKEVSDEVGNTFEVLASSEKTGYFSALLLVSVAPEWKWQAS